MENDPDLIRAAYILSKDPAFEAVIDRLKTDAVGQFMTSAPDDAATRDQAYSRSFSLTQIEQQVKTWAAQFKT